MNTDTTQHNRTNAAVDERAALSKVWAWGWVALCAVCAAIYYATTAEIGDIAYTIIGIAVIPVCIIGVVKNRPSTALPWILSIACLVIHIVAYVLRDVFMWSWGQPGAPLGGAVPDLVLVIGYIGLIVGMSQFIRARSARRDPWLWADGALVTIAAFQVVWTVIVEPTLARSDEMTMAQAVIQSSHPVLDALLMFCVFRLTFSRTYSVASFRFFVMSTGSFVIADFILALAQAGHIGISEYGVYGLFFFTYAGIGAATLHPSMRLLTVRQPDREAVTGTARLAVVSAALFVPMVIFAFDPEVPSERRIVMGVSGLVLVAIVVVRVVKAVIDHSRSNELLGHAATHDDLTGLPNRTLLIERCTESLVNSAGEWGRSTALLFIDLDQFKHVNDTLGHPVGDQMLIAVSQRLTRAVRGGDVVSRLGGDEFVICLDGVRGDDALIDVCDRIMALFEDPVSLDAGEVYVTPSIGISVSNGDSNAEEMLRNADIAMYEAKDSGRNGYVFFDEAMREKVAARMDIETKLRRAIDESEMRVAYQPIVELADRRPAGVEALLRWEHPTDGFKSPAEFIPIAEDTGMIVPLGEWVLDQSCEALAAWRSNYPEFDTFKVSVNLSARQLVGDGPMGAVATSLERHGVHSDHLWLEVTESLVMGDRDTAIGMLNELRSMGVHLAVDDFGTDHASLTYVRDLPVEIVKIDRSFVSDLDHSDSAKATRARKVVEVIIVMAHTFGNAVVAEGIETEAQAEILKALGCEFGQGYLFSPAVTPDEIDVWLANNMARQMAASLR